MKKLSYIIMAGLLMTVASCQKDFIDLNPNAQFTDAVYFKQPIALVYSHKFDIG